MQEETQPIQGKGKNTSMAILAYFLFFVPLLTDAKNDPFVKYHIKQGFILFLGWIVVSAVSWTPFAYIFSFPLMIGMVALLVIGVLNAANGKEKPLPLVGQFAEKFNF